MNEQPKVLGATPALKKPDAALPALIVTGRDTIAIRSGVEFNDATFAGQHDVVLGKLESGCDYGVIVNSGIVSCVQLNAAPVANANLLGGFHFAPGGNATARSGGDGVPAINPHSVWDACFRPACPDPRGMTRVVTAAGSFWCDIYLTGADHLLDGTSRFHAEIADGESPPQKLGGGRFERLDYPAALEVMRHHGKSLLSLFEFFEAAYGVAEKTACGGDPERTQLDALRTSKWGLMQATGNLWQWGHDGDPDSPRASLFGGSWWHGEGAGSRCADLGDWPGYSVGRLGARGRCDHLQLA